MERPEINRSTFRQSYRAASFPRVSYQSQKPPKPLKKPTFNRKETDIMNYLERFQSALIRAKSDYPIVGWYGATESAADAYNVSLPELQRALEYFLKTQEG